MDAEQKARREEIVRAMKKRRGEFKRRYGKDAKRVMYATATKMAVNEDAAILAIASITSLLYELLESHYPTQGSSVEYPKYQKLNMDKLVQDATAEIEEDDGPHTSAIADPINFTTHDHPERYINQPSSQGNRENPLAVAARRSGKPMKQLRTKTRPQSTGVEDFSGAVAGVAARTP